MKKRTIAEHYIHDFASLAWRFDLDWRQPQHWRQQLKRVIDSYRLGTVVSEPLARFQRELGAGEKAVENARSLAERGTVAIVTGQQAGLATGPLYTIYKALAVLKAARELAEREQSKVIPVFWLASEDHDWLEISHCYWPGRQWRWPDPPGAGRKPAGLLAMTMAMEQTIWEMIRCLPEGTGRTETGEWLAAALKGAGSPAGWVARLLARLLGEQGLVIVDPMLPELRQALQPFWQETLAKGAEIPALICQAGEQLAAAGWQPALAMASDRTGLFYLQNDERIALTVQELTLGVELAVQEPVRLSCSVATRPLAQDRLLPTVAYVAGPGELAYYAQLREVYHLFGQTMPILLPRWSVTLVEPEQKKVLNQWQLSLPELAELEQQEIDLRLASRAGWNHEQLLADLRERWQKEHAELFTHLAQLEPELELLQARNWNYISYQLDYLKGKVEQKLRRQYRQQIDALLAARQTLWPGGKRQERVLNLTWFLSRWGKGWLHYLLHAPLDWGQHYYLELGGSEDGYHLYQG
ncbi:bacillithiol biosynthesis cysteine-adding enzyme BshC [Carboxydocella sp. JDF658]|uniref:bacillithiol biosynthesis cysteine-adding enzyme BshC n=1 Tax=Carboxydocella sp. JDF658 TaxID=1926600 RepID=UPI0009ABFFD7|nr:bacillithiol biosynthesis cysteine-adding enzyme BshC [Carboxydocella sp. JDF658]GAW32280.1 bacillithiol biosynthesis cysteine-adding enzyme BshC [Carboxydocella sp. JDF658]